MLYKAALNRQNIGYTEKKEYESIVPIARNQIGAEEKDATRNEQVGFVFWAACQVQIFTSTYECNQY